MCQVGIKGVGKTNRDCNKMNLHEHLRVFDIEIQIHVLKVVTCENETNNNLLG